jgi:hypothetical protein
MTEYITVYTCVYRLDNHRKSVSTQAGLSAFRDGFWATKTHGLSQGSETDEYWIPPTAILYIRKSRLKKIEPTALAQALGRDAVREVPA